MALDWQLMEQHEPPKSSCSINPRWKRVPLTYNVVGLNYRKVPRERLPPRDRPPLRFSLNIDHAMSEGNRIDYAICGIGMCDKHVCQGFSRVYRTVIRESAASAICSICSHDMHVFSGFLHFCPRSACAVLVLLTLEFIEGFRTFISL